MKYYVSLFPPINYTKWLENVANVLIHWLWQVIIYGWGFTSGVGASENFGSLEKKYW